MSTYRAPPSYRVKYTIALFGKGLLKAIENTTLNGDVESLIVSNNVTMQENNSFKVINTGHFFDKDYQHPDQLVIDIMALSHPGPHLFILAIDPEDTEESTVHAQIRKLQDAFGENMTSHLVIMLLDGKTYNSLSHLSDHDIKLVMFSENLANDCEKWCNSRHSFIYDYKHYSQDVVVKRKKTLEKRRDYAPLAYGPLHYGGAGNNVICQPHLYHQDPKRVTPLQHTGNGGHEDFEGIFNIVLLGLSGTGKSASANTILAAGNSQLNSNGPFKSESSSLPVTTKCEAKLIELFGSKVRVVDTPDFFHDQLQDCEAQIEECKRFCQPTCSILFLVLQLSRFTDEEKGILQKLEQKLGWEIRSNTFVLLTHGEDLTGSPEHFVRRNPHLWEIIEKCNCRFHLFKNSSKDTKQVKRLMKKISGWRGIFPQLEISQKQGCAVN